MEVMVLLLSFWIALCFWAFHLGLRPMYYFLWEFAYVIITLLHYFVPGIVVCLFYSSLSHWDICRSDIILFYSHFLCYTVWHILYLALLNKWDVTLMVSEQFVLRMTWGCGFVMPRDRELSCLVKCVSKIKSFKNRKMPWWSNEGAHSWLD